MNNKKLTNFSTQELEAKLLERHARDQAGAINDTRDMIALRNQLFEEIKKSFKSEPDDRISMKRKDFEILMKDWIDTSEDYKKVWKHEIQAQAEISYWRYRAEQIADKNQTCLICLTKTNEVDPPYNLINTEWDKFPNQKEFLKFTFAWIYALIPKLKENSSLYIFNTPKHCALILSYLLNENKLYFRNWITWYKKDGLSVAKKQFCNNQETILFFTRGKGYTFNYDEIRIPYTAPNRVNSPSGVLKNGKRWFPHPNGKLCPDVWEISSDRHKKKINGKIIKNDHPTPKPEDMVERMIKASSNKGDLVLDLFSGTGTTSFCAKRLGRNFIGVEKNKKFWQIAKERLKNIIYVKMI